MIKKHGLSIDLTYWRIMIFFKDLNCKKHFFPIEVAVEWMIISFNETHFSK